MCEVGRDALEEGPNIDALRLAVSIVDEPVVAAGGVRDLADIARLTQIAVDGKKLAGLVVGREITAGRFTVEEAAAALTASLGSFGPWTRADLDVALAKYRNSLEGPKHADCAAAFVTWLANGGAESA